MFSSLEASFPRRYWEYLGLALACFYFVSEHVNIAINTIDNGFSHEIKRNIAAQRRASAQRRNRFCTLSHALICIFLHKTLRSDPM
jgi:hypothetical protein